MRRQLLRSPEDMKEVSSTQSIGQDWFPPVASESGRLALLAQPEGVHRQGYYGIPLLKPPTWRWHITGYFYLEGISAGSYLVSALVELAGKKKYNSLGRTGFYLSLATLMPCPPLLIWDLGDPRRFHHMFRVIKPVSPMNLGSWLLAGFGIPTTLIGLKQLSEDFRMRGIIRRMLDAIPRRALTAAGIPFAFLMCSYTGVLLSSTSIPVWKRTRALGSLFACAALSTGVSALYLVNSIANKKLKQPEVLRRIHAFSAAAESAALAAYLAGERREAAPLFSGKYAALFWGGVVGAGLLAPALIRRRSRRIAAALALAGGLALKWSIVYSGGPSARRTTSAQL